MKAIDLIFRWTPTEGRFETESRVSVFMDEAGNGYGDTFPEVRRNGRLEAYRYKGMAYGHMQNPMEAILLNKANRWTGVSAKALYLHRQIKKIKPWKSKSLLSRKWKSICRRMW